MAKKIKLPMRWAEPEVGPAATAETELPDLETFGISGAPSGCTSTCNFRPFLQLSRLLLAKYRIPSSSSKMLSKPSVYILIGLLILHDSYSSLLFSSAMLSCAAEYVNPANPHNK